MLTKKQKTSQLSAVSGTSGLLFASALALGLLVGCGGGSDAGSQSTEATKYTTAESAAATEPEVIEPEAASETAEVEAAPEATTDTAEAETESEATMNNSAEEAEAKEEAPLDAAAGAELYEKTCKVCHGTGLLSSPKLGDKVAWAPRIAKGKETLYEHSAKGFNQMPPQAAGEITEAQVHAAVDYMIEQSS
ncbi:c-type cytochrome [Psychrobacter lutiphocae]|uniref:c-type cytochrome n=1 Tax=Psychrobacter lutiphocae TaxID=540500 RepID=UPI00035E9E31|nr:c-type cytochrome [Psychrobacter lutiphocae]